MLIFSKKKKKTYNTKLYSNPDSRFVLLLLLQVHCVLMTRTSVPHSTRFIFSISVVPFADNV